MLFSQSNYKDYTSMPSNTENLVRSESMKNEGDLSNLNKCDTADLKTVVSKKKMDYSRSYWLLMVCFLLILIGSTVFVFYTQGSAVPLETECSGDLVFDKCYGDCQFKCGDGDTKACSMICAPGCTCPSGLYRYGDKCFKKEDCPPTPKGKMLKVNKMLTLYI